MVTLFQQINAKLMALSVRTLLASAGTLLALGLGTGLFLDASPASAPGTRETGHEERLGGYRFINPLLDCEISDDPVEFRELKPFQDRIERLIRERSDDYRLAFVSVYFRDLMNGPWFGINEKEPFTPASLLKVPIVMAALKQAERDPSFLSRRIRNTLSEDRNRPQMVKPAAVLAAGEQYPVEELIRRSIVYSDNNAAALLAKTVDEGILLQTYRDLGVKAPRLNIQYPFLPVKMYASFFRILFNASYLERADSQRALEYLAQSDYRNGLVAGVPPYILVAHKFGEHAEWGPGAWKQLHDCGIVYYPGHPYLLCVMSRGTDFSALDDIITEISALTYGEIDRQFGAAAKEPRQ